MTAATICSDFGAPRIKFLTVSTVFPSICHEVMGLDHQCVLGKTLLAFVLLHSVLQGQICLHSTYLLTYYFCIPVPYKEKDIFFGC